MSLYYPGTLVLLAFPFVDASGSKRRPALVLFDGGDADILVARVTSQAPRTMFDVAIQDWRGAGLRLPSIVRIDKLATMEKQLVERTLGHLPPGDWSAIRTYLQQFWANLPP